MRTLVQEPTLAVSEHRFAMPPHLSSGELPQTRWLDLSSWPRGGHSEAVTQSQGPRGDHQCWVSMPCVAISILQTDPRHTLALCWIVQGAYLDTRCSTNPPPIIHKIQILRPIFLMALLSVPLDIAALVWVMTVLPQAASLVLGCSS